MSHTYILTVTAKLRGPTHRSKEFSFSQDVPWHVNWAVVPISHTKPIAGYAELPKLECKRQLPRATAPKAIATSKAGVDSGTKSSQTKTTDTTITALDAQDDDISCANSSQLAFERGEEERRGLKPIYKAWWKKGIKDDDFRHM
jgi:hypothetical protein